MKNLLVVLILLSHSLLSYSAEQVTIIMSSGPGGFSHRYSLNFAPFLSQALNLPVVIIPKPGAEGTLAAQSVSRCRKDQHCILFSSATPIKYRQTPYVVNLLDDVRPIAYAGSIPILAFTHKNSKYNTINELLTAPDPIAYGVAAQSPIRGTVRKIFKPAAGSNVVEIAYKSGSGVIQDVLSKNLTFGLTTADVLSELETNGRIKIITVIGNKSSNMIPHAPILSVDKWQDDFNITQNNYFFWANNDEDSVFINNFQKAVNEYLTGKELVTLQNQMDIHLLIKQRQHKELLSSILKYE